VSSYATVVFTNKKLNVIQEREKRSCILQGETVVSSRYERREMVDNITEKQYVTLYSNWNECIINTLYLFFKTRLAR
jgi:hypothetical protein